MPVYEYLCEEHGVFDELRPIALAKSNAPCPDCGAEARRVLSVPQLARLATGTRRAHEVNERSRHEPRLVERPRAPAREPGPRPLHAGHGRPWALGH